MKRDERREFTRIPIDMRVTEEVESGVAQARAVDICALGMRYVKPVAAPTRVGREVMLEFRLPGEKESVRVLGWVAGEEVEKSDRFTSVTFAFLRDEDAARLGRYLSRAKGDRPTPN